MGHAMPLKSAYLSAIGRVAQMHGAIIFPIGPNRLIRAESYTVADVI
jgi:hypothetical protein